MISLEDREPVEIYNLAIAALNHSDWAQAQQLAALVGKKVPDHAGVHFVAGVAAMELQQFPRAMGHLERAVQLNPNRPDYLAQLARALVMARLYPQSQLIADKAMALQPSDAMTLDALGVVYNQGNAYSKAEQAFKQAAALVPTQASYRFNFATALTFSGDIEASEIEYEACLSIDPGYWKAHLALAHLHKQTAASNHVSRLSGLLDQRGGEPGAQLYVNLALAKEKEDLGDYSEALDHLVAGKSSAGHARKYTSQRDAALFDAIKEASQSLVHSSGFETEEPIFVIGMPRTGTTLVERIISSHSTVQSVGELQNFSVELKRASGSQTREILDPDTMLRLGSMDWKKLGSSYLDSTRPGTGSLPHFVDKLPHNFLFAGFIAQAMPKAKIICLRRDPVDTCLSNFRQLFSLGSPYYDYSFDLMDTARYYGMFDALMKHWDHVIPGRIHTLSYESLVDHQGQQTRQILEFCGLPFESRCLDFEQNSAPVATASAVQVRSKINRNHLQRWRRYGEQLNPLLDLLEAQGIQISR